MRLARPLLLLGSIVAVPAFLEFAIVTLDVAPPRDRPLMIWNPAEDAGMRSGNGAFRFNAQWLWEPRPGAEWEGEAINADGFRGPTAPRALGPSLRIAVLGDSSTFALGVREAEGWGRQLEAALAAGGVRCEVLNFGCVGFTAAQGLALFLGKVRLWSPDVVIAAFGAANEQFPGPGGLTDGEKMLRLQQPALKARLFLDRYATVRWLASLLGKAEAAPSDAHDWKPRVPKRDFELALAALKSAVEQDGARLLLVDPPRPKESEARYALSTIYTDAVKAQAATLGVPLAEVHDALRSAEGGPEAIFIDAWHPSPAGHRMWAGIVADSLRSSGLIDARRPRP